jgi:hypothetical protein
MDGILLNGDRGVLLSELLSDRPVFVTRRPLTSPVAAKRKAPLQTEP